MVTESQEYVVDDYNILSRAEVFSYKTAEVVFPQWSDRSTTKNVSGENLGAWKNYRNSDTALVNPKKAPGK